MAISTAWKYKALVRVNPSFVDQNLSGFPFALTNLNLPLDMITANGSKACKEDGEDIRLTTDAAGLNEIPVEITYCDLQENPAESKIEIWAKGDVVTGAYSYFWVWWGNPSATEPSPSSTFGWYNVWDSNFKLVSHYSNYIGDSTSNDYPATNNGSTFDSTKSAAGVGSQKFVRASAQYIDYGNILNLTENITLEIVMRLASLDAGVTYGFMGKGDHQYHMGKNSIGANIEGMVAHYAPNWKVSHLDSNPDLNTWFYMAGRRDNYNQIIECFLNGVPQSEAVSSTGVSTSSGLFVVGTNGEFLTERNLDGWVEEVRVSDGYRSNAWLKASQAAILTPASFITVFDTVPAFGGADNAILRGINRGLSKGVC